MLQEACVKMIISSNSDDSGTCLGAADITAMGREAKCADVKRADGLMQTMVELLPKFQMDTKDAVQTLGVADVRLVAFVSEKSTQSRRSFPSMEHICDEFVKGTPRAKPRSRRSGLPRLRSLTPRQRQRQRMARRRRQRQRQRERRVSPREPQINLNGIPRGSS